MEDELLELTALLDANELEAELKLETNDPKCSTPTNNANKPKSLRDFNMFDERESPTLNENEKNVPSVSGVNKNVPSVSGVNKNVPSVSGVNKKISTSIKSEVHTGDTDSSDDEDNKYCAEQKYNESGRSIKHLMNKTSTPLKQNNTMTNKPSWKSKGTMFAPSEPKNPIENLTKDAYTDPYFGLRIVTPLISFMELRSRMQDKAVVSFSRIRSHVAKQPYEDYSWVLGAVVVAKQIKTSQKGKPYLVWTLSDLQEGMRKVSVYMFGKAYDQMCKKNTHIAVAILDPKPLKTNNTSKDEATLSVFDPEKIMILGQSKDLGTCRSRKKNGEPCTSIVNKNRCEYCIYHVKQEYSKFTARSELQAPSGGSLNDIKKKVLGKHEVFYAGRSYTANVAKPARKQVAKDQKTLSQLFNQSESRFGPKEASVPRVVPHDSARVRLMKDAERLQKLSGKPATLTSLTLSDHSVDKKKHDSDSKSIERLGKLTKGNHDTVGNMNIVGEKILNLKNKDSFSAAKACAGLVDTKTLKKKTQERINKNESEPTKTRQLAGFGSSKLNSSDIKKEPTKTRFDSLNKLKSLKSSEKSPLTVRETKTSKGSCRSQPDDFDVCFEFDERNTSKTFKSKTNEVDLKSTMKSSVVESSKHQVASFTKELYVPKESGMQKTPHSHPEPRNELLSSISSEKCIDKRVGLSTSSPKGSESLENTAPNHEVTLKKGDGFDEFFSTVKPEAGKLNLSLLNKSSSSQSRQSTAKLKALKYVKEKGPITKIDPSVKKTSKELLLDKKRKRTEEEEKSDPASLTQRFLDLMTTTSKHSDLIAEAENKALEEYYEKMEKKERMEEKMMNTFKVDCKAVRCLKCHYMWFSASEKCKVENHPLKVISASKRFFQCQICKRRTVSLDIVPLHNCLGCGGDSWTRVPMLQERKPANAHLSIRGGEQKFTNSVVTDANLDLLVPDDAS